jgi:hypothetical protein
MRHIRNLPHVPALTAAVPVTYGYAFGTLSAFHAALMPARAPVLICFL